MWARGKVQILEQWSVKEMEWGGGWGSVLICISALGPLSSWDSRVLLAATPP